MLLREIFRQNEPELEKFTRGISLFMKETKEKFSFSRSIYWSILIHIIVLFLAIFIAKAIIILLMFMGFDMSLFEKPVMKIRDIEFVLVMPDEKYNLQKSFLINNKAKTENMLTGPEPNNRPYNGDEGSLKSELKEKSVAKDNIVNEKPLKNTEKAASQTNKTMSKKAKKGNYIPQAKTPDAFTINAPKTEMNTDFGFGAEGKSGIHSPSAGNATFKSGGAGSGSSGVGDSVGNGTTKGGGYYYGNAGAPRPQKSSQYQNNSLDVDLRPYVTELQRKIVRNWSMPSNENNKKTVLFLRISKSGNLMIMNIKTPSGDTYIDNLAISAVKKAQPFSPLPAGYKNAYADIILTFDYNVSARPN